MKAVLTSVKAALSNIGNKKHSPETDECFRDFGRAVGFIRLRCQKSADTTVVVADFDRCTRFCLAVSATGSTRQRTPRHAVLEPM